MISVSEGSRVGLLLASARYYSGDVAFRYQPPGIKETTHSQQHLRLKKTDSPGFLQHLKSTANLCTKTLYIEYVYLYTYYIQNMYMLISSLLKVALHETSPLTSLEGAGPLGVT